MAHASREIIIPGKVQMSEARVKAGIWVSAALRMADLAGRPRHGPAASGDPDSGGVLCVLRGRGGVCVLSQARTGEGDLAWMRSYRRRTGR